jgi:hypothetical protein
MFTEATQTSYEVDLLLIAAQQNALFIFVTIAYSTIK